MSRTRVTATAIVVFTRHRDLGFVREALGAGASVYVLKESPIEELWRAINSAMKGNPYIDSVVEAAFDDPVLELKGQVSNRERDVLRRTALGQSNKEIAPALKIAVRTVEVHKTTACGSLTFRIGAPWSVSVFRTSPAEAKLRCSGRSSAGE